MMFAKLSADTCRSLAGGRLTCKLNPLGAWLASDGITVINQAAPTALIAGLMGDTIVKRLGTTRVIVLGGLFAAMGMALATLAPSWSDGSLLQLY